MVIIFYNRLCKDLQHYLVTKLSGDLMNEILFENKNATVKKVSKETENGAKEYVYLDLLDENGNIKTSIPLKEPKKEEQKNNNK